MESLFRELELPDYLYKPALLVIGLAIIWTIVKVFKSRISKSKLDNQAQYKAKKGIVFAGYVAFLITLITVYSASLGGFTVALGVAGAGIAFALQEVIASFAGWLALIFGNFYKTGDRVQLGGIKGDVIDIGVLRTTLMETGSWVDGDLYNGRIVRIANSFVFKEPVFNYSGDFPFLWDEIKIPVRFGSDYSLARKIIEDAAYNILSKFTQEASSTWKHMTEKYMIEDAMTEPMVTLVVNDNWVEYTLRYVVNFKRRRLTKDLLFTTILTVVDNTGGKVQFASATFDIVGLPELNVKLKSNG